MESGKQDIDKVFALEVQGLSKTYTKTVSGFDTQKNWEKMLWALKANRKNKTKESLVEFHALCDISLKIRHGESLGIIGLNGSGKSTLLQIIAGTLEPTSGTVQTNGRIAALLELGSGFNPDFTGKENIYLNATILGLSQSEIDAKYEDIVAFADIGDFIHQPVRTYSSGMGLRLAFAVVAHVEPEILIIDEALAVGDVRFQAKCFCFLESLQNQGKTLLFVSHDMNSVARLCSSAMLLNKGEALAIGDPCSVINEYSKLIGLKDENKKGDVNLPTKVFPKKNRVESTVVASQSSLHSATEESLRSDDEWTYGGTLGKILKVHMFNEQGEKSTTIKSGEWFSIYFVIIALAPISSPIYAMKIRDAKGQELYGQNTLFAKVPTEDLESGDMFEICFRQRANLGHGTYLASLGFTRFEDNSLQVIHRRHDAFEINIINTDGSFGISNCFSTIDLKQLEKKVDD